MSKWLTCIAMLMATTTTPPIEKPAKKPTTRRTEKLDAKREHVLKAIAQATSECSVAQICKKTQLSSAHARRLLGELIDTNQVAQRKGPRGSYYYRLKENTE